MNEFLQVSWTQLNGAADVIVAVEFADKLEGPWFGGPGLFVMSHNVRLDGLKDVSVRDRVPAGQTPRRFLRIRIELAE